MFHRALVSTRPSGQIPYNPTTFFDQLRQGRGQGSQPDLTGGPTLSIVGPLPPAVMGPSDGASLVTPVTFAWKSPLPNTQQVQVVVCSDSALQSSCVAPTSVPGSQTSVQIQLPPGQYFW